ncbi:hypothetical protein LTR05_006629 [Lithohypha guttulata]|uniref:Uncharacterized protein n=1 Tax=Lithohypha guttulata TaxID=1690604 RepID=A0AAN7Y9B9_9EURO|nr:hypothetical protein LTR05_006629 [Lithohypha guttulata]
MEQPSSNQKASKSPMGTSSSSSSTTTTTTTTTKASEATKTSSDSSESKNSGEETPKLAEMPEPKYKGEPFSAWKAYMGDDELPDHELIAWKKKALE